MWQACWRCVANGALHQCHVVCCVPVCAVLCVSCRVCLSFSIQFIQKSTSVHVNCDIVELFTRKATTIITTTATSNTNNKLLWKKMNWRRSNDDDDHDHNNDDDDSIDSKRTVNQKYFYLFFSLFSLPMSSAALDDWIVLLIFRLPFAAVAAAASPQWLTLPLSFQLFIYLRIFLFG